MDWIQLIGAIGLGAIVTKLLDVLWLQRVLKQNEQSKWLREQRFVAYSVLAKELVSHGLWSGTTSQATADGLAAEAMLLADDELLANRIDKYFRDVAETKRRLSRMQSVETYADPEKRGELESANRDEFQRLQGEAGALVSELRRRLLRN